MATMDYDRLKNKGQDKVFGNRIVFFGDSITAGSTDNANNYLAESYPFFASLLSGGKVFQVRNAGVGGNKTADMIARFDNDVTPFNPNVVALLAGTNDAGAASGVTFFQYKERMKTLVGLIRGIGAVPVLGTIPPNATPANRVNISLWNHWLRLWTQTENIILIDFYKALVDTATGAIQAQWTADGTHPTIPGQLVMANLFNTVMANILPPQYPPFVMDQGDSTSHLLGNNPLLTVDTNADGIPDNWIAYGGSTGFAHALVTDANIPGKMAQITQTANASVRILQKSVALVGYAPGDQVFIGAVATSDGGVNTELKITFQGPNTAVRTLWTVAATRGYIQRTATVPAGCNGILFEFVVGAGTGVGAIGQPTLVNLTTLGIQV